MKILIVSRYKEKYPSRQAPFVTEQAEAIRALGHEIEYYLVRGNYVKQYFALRKKIKEYKPDIIHAHYGLTACIAELQRMVPVVTTFHNGETHTKHVNFLSSLFSKLAKHVIYVAPHIRQKLYFKVQNYSIIPCGISLDDCFLMEKAEARKELGWEQDKKYILFGGAFHDLRKNAPLLKEAVALLKRDDIIVEEMWKRTRRECMLMMNAADVFALPTKNEGSPQALKEAMACNCLIVATDVADIKYMVGDVPGHWILANKKGTPADWVGDEHSAEELAGLLKNALNFNGRTQGRERIQEIGYTNEQIARKIVEIYEDVC
jgi:glycosyltransferase involved in cell wall biosynthesis